MDEAVAMEERIFKERFIELVEYLVDHDNCDVPRDGSKLGLWVHGQRSQFKKNQLPEKRRRILQAIGFNFKSSDDVLALEEKYFKSRVYDLLEYRTEHGDCNVPSDQSRLARWVASIRTKYKKNEISEKRIKLLESLGFEWKRTQARTGGSKSRSAQAQTFLQDGVLADFGENGHDDNNNFTLEDDDNDDGDISQMGVDALDGTTRRRPNKGPLYTDFDNAQKGIKSAAYAADLDRRWQERFEELVKFKEQHGHTNVPQYKGALGRWVKAQREHKKQTDLTNAGAVFPPGKKQPACLSPDRIAKLDSIGFQWKVNTIVGWENRYQQLLEYRRQHGDVHVPQAYPEDVAFGRWVMRQRVQYHLLKKGKPSTMSEERIARLEAIGFAWVAPGFHQKGQKTGKRKRADDESEADATSDEENEVMEPAHVGHIPYYHHHHHNSPHQYQYFAHL